MSEEIIMLSKKELSNTFSMEVEHMVYNEKLSYMDAIVFAANKRNMEPETAAGLLNINLKAKVEAEARDLNFLPRRSKLPL